MNMKQVIDHYLDCRKTALSVRTVNAYKYDLIKFCNYTSDKNITEITEADIERYIANQRDVVQHSGVTLARQISTLRSFFKYLHRKKFITDDPTINLESPQKEENEPQFLTIEESEKLLTTIQKTASPYYHARDVAIVELILSTGLRLRELVSLRISNVDLTSKPPSIKILRKGNKEQRIPLNGHTLTAMKVYLDQRPKTDNEYVFVSRKNVSTVDGYGISPSNVYVMIKKYLLRAGIDRPKVAVHSLRHTVATTLLSKGKNIMVIKKLLGHRSIMSTQIYIHINDQDLEDAVNVL